MRSQRPIAFGLFMQLTVLLGPAAAQDDPEKFGGWSVLDRVLNVNVPLSFSHPAMDVFGVLVSCKVLTALRPFEDSEVGKGSALLLLTGSIEGA